MVDLGEDDEGDWGVEGDGGGGESSMGTENPPNFPEVMLPHSDGTMPATGDPAMVSVPFDVFSSLMCLQEVTPPPTHTHTSYSLLYTSHSLLHFRCCFRLSEVEYVKV